MSHTHLFNPLQIGDVTLRNRIAVSPMCQYSSDDGFSSDWHLVHLGSRAVGGAALVFTEATAVEPRGRISPQDLGLWKDEHIPGLARIAKFIGDHGASAGIQLAHSGRKGSTQPPWKGSATVPAENGGWTTVGPTDAPFRAGEPSPIPLTVGDIHEIAGNFQAAAKRAAEAGFHVIEIHAAHGYLFHEFLSPLSNARRDEYGGSLANRARFLEETVLAVRSVWPRPRPLLVRISASDWTEGGWTQDDSIALAVRLKGLGVDMIDCSSGGNVPQASIPLRPGYQVPFSRAIRESADILTGAVGLITDPQQAENIISSGDADLVLLAREMLRDPYFPWHAARALGVQPQPPVQYGRAF